MANKLTKKEMALEVITKYGVDVNGSYEVEQKNEEALKQEIEATGLFLIKTSPNAPRIRYVYDIKGKKKIIILTIIENKQEEPVEAPKTAQKEPKKEKANKSTSGKSEKKKSELINVAAIMDLLTSRGLDIKVYPGTPRDIYVSKDKKNRIDIYLGKKKSKILFNKDLDIDSVEKGVSGFKYSLIIDVDNISEISFILDKIYN